MHHSRHDVERSHRLNPLLGQTHMNNSWPLRGNSEGCGKQRDLEMLIAFRLRKRSGVGHATEIEEGVKHGSKKK